MDSRRPPPQVSMKRRSLIFALGMVVLLVMFWIGGDNGVVYVASLLGVPIVSGVLAGLHWIRFWLAALACLAVVALDVVFDDTGRGRRILRCPCGGHGRYRDPGALGDASDRPATWRQAPGRFKLIHYRLAM